MGTSGKQDEESESEVARSPRPQNEREIREKTRSSRQYKRSKAVWQVVKPLSSKTLELQEQLLAQLSTSLVRQGLRLEEGTHGPSLLTVFNSSNVANDINRDLTCLQGGERGSLIIVSFLPFREVSPRIFGDAKTQASSIPDCGILVELFVDTSGTLLLNCAHNTQEINRVISFLFK